MAAPLMVTPAQKLVSDRREIWTPSRVWMRMLLLETVTMCVVPTAPIVSGGMVVPLRNSALNVLAGAGAGPVGEGGTVSGVSFEDFPTTGRPLWMSGAGCGASMSSMSVLGWGGGVAFRPSAVAEGV